MNNNKTRKITAKMLHNLSAITASTKYGSSLQPKGQYLLITNQYLFLWNVLPRFAKLFIPKSKFLKQMKKLGFSQVREPQQTIIGASIASDMVICLKGPVNIVQKLEKMAVIRLKKGEEKQKLYQKTATIKKLLQQNVQANKDVLKQFQLLEAISSLKQINRMTYLLHRQQSQILVNCQQQIQLKFNNNITSGEMIDIFQQDQREVQHELPNFYTLDHLRK